MTTDRYSPLPLSTDITLANRVVVPAMASGTADELGFATAKTIAHYQRLALAKPGLLFVEYTFVHRSGRSEPNQLSVDEDAKIPGLKRIAMHLREAGIVPGLQITHAGGKSSRDMTDGTLMTPSGITVPAKDRTLPVPDRMSIADIQTWRMSFTAAATRAAAAGFAAVELHAAHGYGLNQWLSPLTNKRDDSYGRDPDGRLRLILEIIEGIRASVPEIILSVRIAGQDHMPGGLTQEDALAIAKRLKAAGVSIINVSSGLGGWRRPGNRDGEGYLVPEARYIQAGLAAPVIGVGGIQTGAYIDAALAAKDLSLAAVGRAILSDPEAWARENLSAARELTRQIG